MILQFLRSFYFTSRFFTSGIGIVCLSALGFAVPILFLLAKLSLVLLVAVTAADTFLLYRNDLGISVKRQLGKVLGLGDLTPIKLFVSYMGSVPLDAELIDELPVQLQERELRIKTKLSGGMVGLAYNITPINKGNYHFGNTNIFISSPLAFVRRKIIVANSLTIPVYPSIKQMHEHELLAFSRMSAIQGSRRLKRIGQSYEFEQISPFVEGDDYRNINWKATGKTRELMVNQYQEERSQNMYCIISKGRAMKMAFNNMSLLDYAINSSLAIANVALKKYDRVGLITFSDKIGTAIRAENRQGQIQKILESLYNEKERDPEPSYDLLYRSISRVVKSRSLLLLFANPENLNMLDRILPILRKINKSHLLVMVMFKDEELEKRTADIATEVDDVYRVTLAKQHLSEKEEIAIKLNKNGIQTVVSYPKDLSLNVINKYLELKSRGMI